VQIADAIRQARQEPKMQALVLVSSNPKVFSAGLDLKELYPQPPPASDDANPNSKAESSDRLIRFWKSFQQIYLELYGCRLATVAALEGHAVAGGCMLALCADYRVMSDDPRVTIGLNESQLGIVAPPWLGQQLVDTVGRRTAELGLMRGTLWNPQDALSINLVDQLAPLKEVRPMATQVASELAKIPESARFMGKKLIRQNRIDRLASNRQEDVDNFVSVITNAPTQKRLGMYLASLAKKGSR
jgi:Delta3-Delta2-enoyl-CoA isomerase